MAPPANLQNKSPSYSLTEWWNLFAQSLDVLEARHPEIKNKAYFHAGREMIAAGLKTETSSFLMLYPNKTSLNRAEQKLGKRIIRKRSANDPVELPGYLPPVDSGLSCQFAIVYYKHLLRYENVIAQGANGRLLQKGLTGDAKGECVEYYQPFTHNAAAQLKADIQQFVREEQDSVLIHLNENYDEFKELCELIEINLSDFGELFYLPQETVTSDVDTHPASAEASIVPLKQKLARYFKFYFEQLNENDPIQLLTHLRDKVQEIKLAIDDFVRIKQMINTIEAAKENHLPFNQFILNDGRQADLTPMLTAAEKRVLLARLQPRSLALPSTPPPKAGLSYQFFSAVAPTPLKKGIDWTFGWQESVPQSSYQPQHYDGLIKSIQQHLQNKAAQLTSSLNRGNTLSFVPTDVTDKSVQSLEQLSLSLSTCTETLSEVEKAVDKYIAKHRFGIAKFVDYKPIRLMTKFFVKIGFSLVINDKYFYFEKARRFKQEVAVIKHKLDAEDITDADAKEKISCLSSTLKRYSETRHRKSQYFKYFAPLRRECRRASQDLSAVATETENAIVGVA